MKTDAPNKNTRLTQIALIVNIVLHCIGSVGMLLGLGPHAAEQATMARRAAAAGFAAIVMFVLVAKRLPRDPGLIALPLAFVFFNLSATIWDYVSTRDQGALAPLLPEATFLTIYVVFALGVVRRKRVADVA